jgi:hypothetical protein
MVGCMVYREKRPLLGCERALREATQGGFILCIFLIVGNWITLVL